MELSDNEWKKKLKPEQYRILRKKGTERAFTGKYHDFHEKGIYKCAGCGLVVFSSDDKFDSGTGWPSFTRPINENAVEERDDYALLYKRREVLCKRCHGHLGHVFDDGPKPTGERYCMNSLALDFQGES